LEISPCSWSPMNSPFSFWHDVQGRRFMLIFVSENMKSIVYSGVSLYFL
jgi:hypothetical protein